MNVLIILSLVSASLSSAAEETAELNAGGSVGTLRILNKLGTGRNSIVYRAVGDWAKLAVKTAMVPNEQLAREAEVLTALNTTTGFPRIYAWNTDEKYIVMELLDGFTSLDKYTNPADIPLPVEQIAISLLDRLESVHAAGFVHVDIHKRNIMVDGETGEVDLIDFGLAVKITEHKSPLFVNLYLSSTVEQARSPLYPVDDIERLMFVLLDCFYHPLPWISMMRMRESLDKKLREGPEVLALATALEELIWANKSELHANEEFFSSRNFHPGFRRVLEYIKTTAEMRRSESFRIDYNLLRSYFRDPADLLTDALTESLSQVKFDPSLQPI